MLPSSQERALQEQLNKLQEELRQEQLVRQHIKASKNKSLDEAEEKIIELTTRVSVAEEKAGEPKKLHGREGPMMMGQVPAPPTPLLALCLCLPKPLPIIKNGSNTFLNP